MIFLPIETKGSQYQWGLFTEIFNELSLNTALKGGFMIPHFMVNTAHKMTSPIIQEIEHNGKYSYCSEFTQKLSLGKLQTLLGMRGSGGGHHDEAGGKGQGAEGVPLQWRGKWGCAGDNFVTNQIISYFDVLGVPV